MELLLYRNVFKWPIHSYHVVHSFIGCAFINVMWSRSFSFRKPIRWVEFLNAHVQGDGGGVLNTGME